MREPARRRPSSLPSLRKKATTTRSCLGTGATTPKAAREKVQLLRGGRKPYFQLEKIIDACFDVAERLFGIRAVEKTGVPVYHPDVRVFEIRDREDRLVAMFLGDYFARSSKRSGAWMSSYQEPAPPAAQERRGR